uniref:Bursicon n=1 Tax=Angiostrongylus cantonensis TaxID=6313 RepID=A0A0K0CVS4_ANGCA
MRPVQRCEGAKFKQRVKAPGCLTKVIVNRFCHGTCSSYFIPRMNSKKLKAVFKSCAACAPKEYDRFDVTLDCPGQNPPQVTKSIIKVGKCECIELDLSTRLHL